MGMGRTTLSFREWIRLRVLDRMGDGVDVGHDVLCLSNPPMRICQSFRSMYAYGAHFRIDDEEHVLQYVTNDSTIAVIEPEAPGRDGHASTSIGEVHRVGIVAEILEVQFYRKKVILMVGSWVPRGTQRTPTILRDRHGFWLADIHARPRDSMDVHILPSMVSQVSVSFWVSWSLNNICFPT